MLPMMPPFMPSLDQTAGSLAASNTSNAITIATAVRHHQIILIMLFLHVALNDNLKTSPTILHSREMGAMFLATIENGSPSMWRRLFRMTKPSFNALCDWLASNTMFRCSRNVSGREKLLIFLYIVCQGMPHNVAAFLFGRSDETINRLVRLKKGSKYKENNKYIYLECSMKC